MTAAGLALGRAYAASCFHGINDTWMTMVPVRRLSASMPNSTGAVPAPDVQSSTTSTPRPPVTSMIRSSGSSDWMSMTWSAPSVVASSRRAASRVVPVMMISDAPACLQATTWESPCWPGPWMSTDEPYPTPASNNAHSMPFDRGVTTLASSADTPSGTLCTTAFHGRYMYWANPPHRCGGISAEV